MMDPSEAPFYKQMPRGTYTLSAAQLEEIRKAASPISTVYEALASHVRE